MARKIIFVIIFGFFLFPGNANASIIDQHIKQFVYNYYQLELKNYTKSYNTAVALQKSVEIFLNSPTDENLSKAKKAWIKARDCFEETRVDRTNLGSIKSYSENMQYLLERRINAWPLNDASIDYVEEDPHAGVINDPKVVLNKEYLIKKNDELGGLTGYGAIEFLLWGQALEIIEIKGTPAADYDRLSDLKKEMSLWGALLNKEELGKVPLHSYYDIGRRPVLDYDKGDPIKERRRLYLRIVTDLLVDDLKAVVEGLPATTLNNSHLKDRFQRVLFGLANCSNFELATKSIYAVLFNDTQIYMQSIPSGNDKKEFQFNIKGMIDIYHAGLEQLALDVNPDLARKIEFQLLLSEADAKALALARDFEEKEKIMVGLMKSLFGQAESFRQLGKYFGISIYLEREKVKPEGEESKDAFSGGATTAFDDSDLAFLRPASNADIAKLKTFFFGYHAFNITWLTSPSSIRGLTELGPIFNRNSCFACHVLGGKGDAPNEEGESIGSMIFQISVPGEGLHGGSIPEPNYGFQIRDNSIVGVPPEGRVIVHYRYIEGRYPDGESYSLRVPKYEFIDLNFGPLRDNFLFSPRSAPFIFGLGLLESVTEETILSFARAQKSNPDGVAGRPNEVWDEEKRKTVLGRFGWKADKPSIRQQMALAFIEDIGITNPIYSKRDIPDAQKQAKSTPFFRKLGISSSKFNFLDCFEHILAVPARRNVNDLDVVGGERIFKRIGCAACHIDTMQTGDNKEIPELSRQTIHPYTDLLLHDMGPGLADGRPDFLATASQWRTPPLWGIGLVQKINKNAGFLHDGRARDLEEAVLWHDGQAKLAQKRFRYLSKEDRQRVLLFLESL